MIDTEIRNDTLQQFQIDELCLNNELLEIHISEGALGGFSVDYTFNDCKGSNRVVYLYTQKNKVRLFKTLGAAFKHVKPLCFTDSELNELSKNIHVHPSSFGEQH